MHAAAVVGIAFAVGTLAMHLARRDAAPALDQADDQADQLDAYAVLDQINGLNPWTLIERQYESAQVASSTSDSNTQAFLAMIAYAEGTDRRADPYRVCYGYKHTLESFADHPALTREWLGERLPDDMCRAAGYEPGCVSTAAGRYQIKKSTWLGCKRALGLTDFSPASQDAAAVYLIRKRGALDDVQRGRLSDAVAKCRQEWASLPGAGYSQPERRIASLTEAFVLAGGQLA